MKIYPFKPTGFESELDALRVLTQNPIPEEVETLSSAYSKTFTTWGLIRCDMAAMFHTIVEKFGDRLTGTTHAERYAEVLAIGRRKIEKAQAAAVQAELFG